MASPGGKLSSEARLMRNAGGNVACLPLLQSCFELSDIAIPHPTRLTPAHLPPGEGKVAVLTVR